ncbi:Response regulator receiver domain-containing protein [Arenibacter palladensis]|uniref:Response regulator receiver domain-containing protein n=2 Tax=Arenibacter palladensis TaxID=237373 RepID=A0A1M4ZA07_9FLAO|nr:Response regulator receiver domain-containing protein [Arenibacter palladensis]
MTNMDFQILLADDDEDDCMFFREALEELSLCATLKTVNNGVELMNFLENNLLNLPQMLFLDLNMPRKSGAECLEEIKQSEKFKHLPVIIYSTSSNIDVMDQLYGKGAQYYIRKPADFSNLKSVISRTIDLILQKNVLPSCREEFEIQP